VGAVHVFHASAYRARHHLRYELQHHRLFSHLITNVSRQQRRADAPEPKWAISIRRFGADLSQRQFLVLLLGGRGVRTNHAESDDSSAFPESCADAESDARSFTGADTGRGLAMLRVLDVRSMRQHGTHGSSHVSLLRDRLHR
jgi:hypothetical protein